MSSKKTKKKINGGYIIKNMFGGFSETFKGIFDIVAQLIVVLPSRVYSHDIQIDPIVYSGKMSARS